MRNTLLALILNFALLTNGLGQQQQPAPAPQPTPPAPVVDVDQEPSADDVVRITTKLVQVDAVVTDRDGKHVTDLTADDFELTENGKARAITVFSYVSAGEDAAAPADAAKKTEPVQANK